MDTEKTPLAEIIPATRTEDISTEGSEEQYHESLTEIERSTARMFQRFFSGLEYVLPLGLISLIVIVLVGVAFAVVVWMLHILMPTDWQWLKEDQVERLQGFFLSGVSGALLAKFLQHYPGRIRTFGQGRGGHFPS